MVGRARAISQAGDPAVRQDSKYCAASRGRFRAESASIQNQDLDGVRFMRVLHDDNPR